MTAHCQFASPPQATLFDLLDDATLACITDEFFHATELTAFRATCRSLRARIPAPRRMTHSELALECAYKGYVEPCLRAIDYVHARYPFKCPPNSTPARHSITCVCRYSYPMVKLIKPDAFAFNPGGDYSKAKFCVKCGQCVFGICDLAIAFAISGNRIALCDAIQAKATTFELISEDSRDSHQPYCIASVFIGCLNRKDLIHRSNIVSVECLTSIAAEYNNLELCNYLLSCADDKFYAWTHMCSGAIIGGNSEICLVAIKELIKLFQQGHYVGGEPADLFPVLAALSGSLKMCKTMREWIKCEPYPGFINWMVLSKSQDPPTPAVIEKILRLFLTGLAITLCEDRSLEPPGDTMRLEDALQWIHEDLTPNDIPWKSMISRTPTDKFEQTVAILCAHGVNSRPLLDELLKIASDPFLPVTLQRLTAINRAIITSQLPIDFDYLHQLGISRSYAWSFHASYVISYGIGKFIVMLLFPLYWLYGRFFRR